MQYFQFHIGDFAKATGHLAPLEELFYLRLIRIYYDTEKALPMDLAKVHRLVRASTDDEREATRAVLEEFFQAADDGWHNHRADEEIAKFYEKSEKARKSAEIGWERRAKVNGAKRNDSEGYANASPSQSDRNTTHNPIPNTHNPEEQDTPLPPTGGLVEKASDQFDQFWKQYPRKEAKPVAKKAFSKLSPSDATKVITVIPLFAASWKWRMEPQYIPHPATWLNQRRFDDDPPPLIHDDPKAKKPSATENRLKAMQEIINGAQAQQHPVAYIGHGNWIPEAQLASPELSAGTGDFEWDPDGMDGGHYGSGGMG